MYSRRHLETKTQKTMYLLRLLSTCSSVFVRLVTYSSFEATFPIKASNEATVHHLAQYVWEERSSFLLTF